MPSNATMIAERRELVASLTEQYAAQAQRISVLELEFAKSQKDSSTSSKSPSSDIVKPPKKKFTGRKKSKRGGQKGHKRQLREPLPVARVDETFVYELDAAEVRDRGLRATDEFETTRFLLKYPKGEGVALVGQRYHERMWTAIATCGKQNRSFFAFLHQAIQAKLARNKTPSLLKPSTVTGKNMRWEYPGARFEHFIRQNFELKHRTYLWSVFLWDSTRGHFRGFRLQE